MEYLKLKKGSKGRIWLHGDMSQVLWQKAKVPRMAIFTYIVLVGEVSRGHHPSLSEIIKIMGPARMSANISRDIGRLEEAGMIEVTRTPAKTNQYKFPHPDFWKI